MSNRWMQLRQNSWIFVVLSEMGSLAGNSLKDIFDEAVHDSHGPTGDAVVKF